MIYVNKLQETNITSGQMNMLFRLRIIFRDIATWIRAYLVSTDPELKQAIKEKLNNLPIEYGNVLRLYFGDNAAKEFTSLFSNYFKLMISLIDAQESGDTNAANEYTKQLDQNVDERVNFLSRINPFWEKNILSNYLKNYNDMTIEEINTFLTKDYKRNVDLFDRILNLTSDIGDYIADGLVKFFTFSSREPRVPE